MTSQEIKNLRKTMGLTQAAFGEKLGITGVSIHNWETEKTKPNGAGAKCLAILQVFAE